MNDQLESPFIEKNSKSNTAKIRAGRNFFEMSDRSFRSLSSVAAVFNVIGAGWMIVKYNDDINLTKVMAISYVSFGCVMFALLYFSRFKATGYNRYLPVVLLFVSCAIVTACIAVTMYGMTLDADAADQTRVIPAPEMIAPSPSDPGTYIPDPDGVKVQPKSPNASDYVVPEGLQPRPSSFEMHYGGGIIMTPNPLQQLLNDMN